MSEEGESSKRKHSSSESSSEDDWVGPMPSEAVQPKKKKGLRNKISYFLYIQLILHFYLVVLQHEKLYLDNLPSASSYEKSYMHRDVITHVVATSTDFLITASCDGHVKFWKKMEEGVEFVKHFRSHLGSITALTANSQGTLLCSVSNDKSLKVFDVINFGKCNIILYNSYLLSLSKFILTIFI